MWTAKLKRFETWDRVFVALNVGSFLYGIVRAVIYFAGGDAAKASAARQPESIDGPGVLFIIIFCLIVAYVLFAECYSLWAIWRHKRAGFIIQLVFASLSAFGGALDAFGITARSTSAVLWIQTGIIAIYCGIRAYQLRPTPGPPPLPRIETTHRA